MATDVAIGAAYAGRRAITTMKHVGLNVAADAFMYAAETGMEAGLVIVSADDPGMHSSQNEQDNRVLAKFARVPCLEPADSQEARDYTLRAFALSEEFVTLAFVTLAVNLAGMARSFLELAVPLIRQRRQLSSGSSLGESPGVQRLVHQSGEDLASARARFYALLDSAWERVESGAGASTAEVDARMYLGDSCDFGANAGAFRACIFSTDSIV